MRVLLSTPPGKTTELWPPLGLLYLASSCAAERDDEVKVVDAFCENLSEDELLLRVSRERPDVLGMNCSTHTFLDTVKFLRRVREVVPDAKIVLGGFHATFASERILRAYPFVDYIIKGEGERSFPDLLEHMGSGSPPSDVAGISYLDGDRLVSNSEVAIEDLDSLPFPDRSLLKNVEYGYFHKNIRLTFGKFTTVSSSRGCPFECTYCSCSAFSKRKWRARSPENVVDELEMLYSDGYECCVFVDDNLILDRKRVERMCDLIRRKRIRMKFYCEGRVDEVSLELLKTMKRAGFDVMYFGVESPNDHVLEYYNKNIDAATARKAIEDAKRVGMIVVTSYIIGAPVESRADVDKTVDFIRATRPHGVQINILDCLIGTKIWGDMERDGLVGPEDWRKNHRIYDYCEDGSSRGFLEDAVNRGYSAHLESWKSLKGLAEIARMMARNGTARTVIMKNLTNADARSRISDGRRFKSEEMVVPESSRFAELE
ncbi:TPA: radical SAM protein [Thermoplasmata archaeon]|nr:radical SAM protein [Thermoplasmata archaeon]